MVTAVAPETDQIRTEEAPLVMLDGLAVKLLMAGCITGGGGGVGGGGGGVITITTAVRVTLPAALVAVRV
jgi:hypothetical protein